MKTYYIVYSFTCVSGILKYMSSIAIVFLSRSDVTKSQISLAKGQNSPAQPATPETQKKKDPVVFSMISGTGEWMAGEATPGVIYTLCH